MAQLFIGGKRMKYLLLLLLTALLLLCSSAYAEQTPQMPSQPPADDASAAVLQIDETSPNDTKTNSSQIDLSEGQNTKLPENTPTPAVTAAPTAALTQAPTNVPEPTATPVPQASVRFSRDFSSQYAESGSTVTLSYTVRNDSQLPITDITVRDGLLGKVGSIDKLDPGQRKTISARVKVTQTCTSSPVISYKYNSESLTKRCSEKNIYLADVDVQVELEVDKTDVAPGEYVTLRLCISNEGNVNLYSMQVVEPMLGEIGSAAASLKAGEESVITRTVQMKSGAAFRFTVSGSSDTGGMFSVQSNEISVNVLPAAAQIEMKLEAQADKTQLEAPGEVQFSLSLNNLCPLELRDVVISEDTCGEIRTLAFVPTGQMPPIVQSYEVSESGTYQFKAQAADSVGDMVTVYSEPIYITVSGEQAKITAEPEETAEAGDDASIQIPDGPSYRMAEEVAAFERLIIWTVLLLIGVLLLWYVVSKVRRLIRRIRRKLKRKKRNKDARR